MAQKILIIDDDEKLNTLLEEYLTSYGFAVKAALLPSIGLQYLKNWSPDLLISDLMMPEQNGLDLCKSIRSYSNIPIIMLTAKGTTTDKIIGLEIGANDYLSKPFEPRELVARIRSQLRPKNSDNAENILVFTDITLNNLTSEVTRDDKKLSFTYKEFTLLWFLASQSPAVVSRDQIMNHLKGIEADALDRSIDVMISRIRNKLGDDAKNPKYLINVRGSGYKLIKT